MQKNNLPYIRISFVGLSIVVTDTIPVVSNRPSGVAHKKPDAARLLVTTAAISDKLLVVWFIDVWFNAAKCSRSCGDIPFRDLRRLPVHIVVPVQRSERTTPHEGPVSGRPKTGVRRLMWFHV